jgi:inhibitor of cysteine peptidase
MPEINTKVGKLFIVELDSNPSTGYQWMTEFDSKFLQLVEKEYRSSTNLVGAGGVDRFKFKALSSGVTNLRMVYKRPFEDSSSEEKNYQVSIV